MGLGPNIQQFGPWAGQCRRETQTLAVQTAPLFLLVACRRVVLDARCREPKLERGAVAVTIDKTAAAWVVTGIGWWCLGTGGPRKAGGRKHYRISGV